MPKKKKPVKERPVRAMELARWLQDDVELLTDRVGSLEDAKAAQASLIATLEGKVVAAVRLVQNMNHRVRFLEQEHERLLAAWSRAVLTPPKD